MPTRIQHPIYGTVFSGDDREIKRLIEEGGVITNAPKKPEPKQETEVKDSVVKEIEVEEPQEDTFQAPKRGRPKLNKWQ